MDSSSITEVSDPLKPLATVREPDVRQANLAESLEDIHAQLSTLNLHDGVPVDIRQLFETAKNVRLYAYFAFRFHQVAEMVAYQALEFALRERWTSEEARLATAERPARAPERGLSRLLERAAADGWLRNEGFSGKWWRARNALLNEKTREALRHPEMLANGTIEIADPTDAEIEERAATIDVVQLVVKYLPKFRNDLAHGSSMLMPRDLGLMQDICDALNMLFVEAAGAETAGEPAP